MRELTVDFITSLDGYGAADGWPGWWGMEGPAYLTWLDQQPPESLLFGANTYRLMSGFAATNADDQIRDEESDSVDALSQADKVVFSSTLAEPLSWANTILVSGANAVAAIKANGNGELRTIGSLSLSRSLLRAGVVDRFRVVIFPVVTGATGTGRIYDDYPDMTLDLISARTSDNSIQLLEYRPHVLDGPPFEPSASTER